MARERPSLLSIIIKKSELVDTTLNYGGMLFTILLMVMTAINVIGRQAFNSPLDSYIDGQQMLMALLVFLSLPFCQLKDGNIRFELFMTRVLKNVRVYHAVEALYLLIALAGFVLIAVYSTKTALWAYVIHDVSPTTHLPIWPAKMGAAVGSIFLCVRLIIQFIQNVSIAFGEKGVGNKP